MWYLSDPRQLYPTVRTHRHHVLSCPVLLRESPSSNKTRQTYTKTKAYVVPDSTRGCLLGCRRACGKEIMCRNKSQTGAHHGRKMGWIFYFTISSILGYKKIWLNRLNYLTQSKLNQIGWFDSLIDLIQLNKIEKSIF